MGIIHREIPHQWNYFFCLEDDVLALSRWIEFSESNEQVYSIELARLLMTAVAEVDVIAKALCKVINPERNTTSIGGYREVLMEAYPDLPESKVSIPRFGKEFQPWLNWKTENKHPLWWTANNKVKHHRAEHFDKANLKNVLNSISGLMVLLILTSSRDMPSLYPGPKVFEPHSYAYRDGDGIAFRI